MTAHLIKRTGRRTLTAAVVGIYTATKSIGREKFTTLSVKRLNAYNNVLVAVRGIGTCLDREEIPGIVRGCQ